MARRTQHSRREERRARAQAERLVAEQERGRYRAPDRRDCAERAWYQSVDDADTVRISHRIFRSGGRLVDFVVLVQTLQLDGTWAEAARADCCHGYVHLHHANGQVSAIGPLHDVGDVASLFDVASTQVLTYAVTIRDMKGSGDGDV